MGTQYKNIIVQLIVLLLITVPVHVAVAATDFSHVSYPADHLATHHENSKTVGMDATHHGDHGVLPKTGKTCGSSCSHCAYCSSIAFNLISYHTSQLFHFEPSYQVPPLYSVDSDRIIRPPIDFLAACRT